MLQLAVELLLYVDNRR